MNAQPLSDTLIEPASEGEWYPSYEAGMAYCRVTRSLVAKGGTKPEKEQRCLELMLDRHLGEVCRGRAIKLVDLGTGDGQKMLLAINSLRAAGAGHIRYVPVDTNPYISRYAILNILAGGQVGIETLALMSSTPVTNAEYIVNGSVTVPEAGIEVDFFRRLPDVVQISKQLGGGVSLYCLLGNTFGNYPAEQREAFLATLFAEVDPGDLFLMGVGLRPNAGASYAAQVRMLEREYMPGEAFMRSIADHPESIYRLRFDPASQSMIHGFERPDGSMQHMGYSLLFSQAETLEAIARTGLEIVAHETYPEATAEPQYLTILARKPVMEHRA